MSATEFWTSSLDLKSFSHLVYLQVGRPTGGGGVNLKEAELIPVQKTPEKASYDNVLYVEAHRCLESFGNSRGGNIVFFFDAPQIPIIEERVVEQIEPCYQNLRTLLALDSFLNIVFTVFKVSQFSQYSFLIVFEFLWCKSGVQLSSAVIINWGCIWIVF